MILSTTLKIRLFLRCIQIGCYVIRCKHTIPLHAASLSLRCPFIIKAAAHVKIFNIFLFCPVQTQINEILMLAGAQSLGKQLLQGKPENLKPVESRYTDMH